MPCCTHAIARPGRAAAVAILAVAALGLCASPCAAEDRVAVVRVTQVQGDGRPMGAPRESDCPQNGCQVGIPLALGKSESLLVNTIVTFVSRGIYLSLEAAVPSSGRVREYGQSRPGTVFVPEPRSGSAVRQFGLTVERDGVPSIGALPDAYLRVEIITGSAAAPGLSPDQGGLLPRS